MNFRRAFWLGIAAGVMCALAALINLINGNAWLTACMGFSAHVNFRSAFRMARTYHDFVRRFGHPP